MNKISNEQRGVAYAILSGLCYGLLGYFNMSIVHSGMSVSTGSFWRFTVSSVIFLCIIIASYKKSYYTTETLSEAIKIILYGAIFYSPGSIAYWFASIYIGTGLAMVIFFTFPIMVIYLNWLFYRQKIYKLYYVVIILIVIGVVLLVDINAFKADIIGILLSLFSALTYALYIIGSKKTTLPPALSTLCISIGCVITSFVASCFNGSLSAPHDFNVIIDIIGVGSICTAIPILFFLKSLQYISSEKVAVFNVLEPVSVLLVGMLVLGEHVTLIQFAGIVAILGGAVITFCIKEEKR